MVELARNANSSKKSRLNQEEQPGDMPIMQPPVAGKSTTAQVAANDSVERFMALFGLLKGSKAFDGDAVELQRQMRDEWR